MTVEASAVARVLGISVGINVGGVPRQAAIPVPPPPPAFEVDRIPDTGSIGDGTFYIADGYCFGFTGVRTLIVVPDPDYVEII